MASTICETHVRNLLPFRAPDAHKGDFGRLLLLCGSVGYTGAAALAAQAAVRSGAGLVYLGVPETVYPILAAKLTEPMVFPLPCEDGCFSREAVDPVLDRLEKIDAVLLGPGMGQTACTRRLTFSVLREAKCPVVLDADGINVLSGHTDVLRKSACPTVVTPHPGEFLRLGGVLDGTTREEAAKQLAQRLNAVCVLKGHGTVVSDGARTRVNTTGNPGMATGGSGDVLAGLLTSLIGQGMQLFDAACSAVWLHGAAGDRCAAERGQMGMLPTDMIDALSRLLP
ncbi:MAG: NAD(P)H-hydrate dehydratase [Oscillospiraceae bacterium]|nr:NAD(P)H-hydrate dehydratase [Oscillospiraceae bacterium]